MGAAVDPDPVALILLADLPGASLASLKENAGRMDMSLPAISANWAMGMEWKVPPGYLIYACKSVSPTLTSKLTPPFSLVEQYPSSDVCESRPKILDLDPFIL